jgi:proton-translocating NAD(P)+ transhydrogenase subunit beta
VSGVELAARLVYLAAATCFVWGLHRMNSPSTARSGNLLSAVGMGLAVLVTAAQLVVDHAQVTAIGWVVLVAGLAGGGVVGVVAARTVRMTAMPQLVSLFNAVGGGAAALLAGHDFQRPVSVTTAVTGTIGIVIGAVTFAGSLVAAGKLQGVVPTRALIVPCLRPVATVVALGGGVWLAASPGSIPALIVAAVGAIAFGVVMVLPIGGADMPVVISLLNALTGTAVALAGFALDQTVLIVAGALVGASGSILTKLMADAMDRSLPAIVLGGFGAQAAQAATGTAGPVRTITADDAAIQLGYASKVIIVPGYGLAAAQAQHAVAELAALLERRGVDVSYAIHPVAGHMPGHMNVLLAEADVPYPRLKEMDEVNPEFARADVALVVGANDVTNPAARRPGNPISGMPILDVDHARSVIVIKRSMGRGYAGIDNELYTDPKTAMFFADAKTGLTTLTAAVKTLIG